MNTPENKLNIGGIHHITAIAASAADNLAFYETVLGLRLVKQTVNFDDPKTYHLYYGDADGSPGTILTFFPWEELPRGRTGAGMVSRIAFAVAKESLGFWRNRLAQNDVAFAETVRFGEPEIHFTDPHGLPLALTGLSNCPAVSVWKAGPIPAADAIRGVHSAEGISRDPERTEALLTEIMGMTRVQTDGTRRRFQMKATDQPSHFYDLAIDPEADTGRQGGGTVHHIAFRAADRDEQDAWRKALMESGFTPTRIIDRNYFTSIYFREPGGVLFEIATDPPGFAVDEAPERLGQTLKLPPQYEPMRHQIESRLPKLRPLDFTHVFEPPEEGEGDGTTMVALHGTGGHERDLVEYARMISGTAAVLSPRGKVNENGLTRFFRRLAPGVLDEADVIRRARELADFLKSAARAYDRDPDRLVAMGYSNGANIAAAILLLRPEVFHRAILVRPMMPLQRVTLPDLTGREILILKGRYDSIIPGTSTDRLAEALKDSGARVTSMEFQAGHEITADDLEAASRWMAGATAEAVGALS